MKFKSSPKIFKNYKCDFPKNTIKRIEDGFKKIGLTLRYRKKEVKYKNCSIHSGRVWIDPIGFYADGKGSSYILSKASAYAELAERFSAGNLKFFLLDPDTSDYLNIIDDIVERRFHPGYRENKDPLTFSLNEISQYFTEKTSTKTYKFFKKSGFFNAIGDSYSLIHNKVRKIPIHLIDLMAGSTGLASGNTMEEAAAQAACEVFERYAASKIVAEKIICPTINPDSIKDEKIHGYIEMFRSMNIDILIKDFTMNNKVPTIGVLFINKNIETTRNKLKKDLYYKKINVGSHINLNEAILRCFIEHLQGLNKQELMYAKKLDKVYELWTEMLNKKYKKTSDDFKYFFREYDYRGDLNFLEKGKKIAFNKLKSKENTDSFDDLQTVLKICKENNWDILVVDLTHKTLQFPTIRTIIPPISTDHDVHLRYMLKFKKDEKHYNLFYGIEDFYSYVNQDSWIKNDKKIYQLIINIEKFLSKEPNSFNLYLTNDRYFYHYINLLRVLGLSYLSLKKYNQALRYFQGLYRIKYNPPIPSYYFNIIGSLNHSRYILLSYIQLIKKISKENDRKKIFSLSNNPFRLKINICYEEKDLIKKILRDINSSYFNKDE